MKMYLEYKIIVIDRTMYELVNNHLFAKIFPDGLEGTKKIVRDFTMRFPYQMPKDVCLQLDPMSIEKQIIKELKTERPELNRKGLEFNVHFIGDLIQTDMSLKIKTLYEEEFRLGRK